jgi:2-hydroxyacyl-CoA lyase 1
MYGTPGPCYIDLPNDLLTAKINEDSISYLPKVELLEPLTLPHSTLLSTLALLKSAKNPLIIVGKGIAYGRAEQEMRAFVEKTGLPFLATPMGKGVVPDKHALNAGSARSYILQNADVVFLCGARLNWILHFGLPPRFSKNVQFI